MRVLRIRKDRFKSEMERLREAMLHEVEQEVAELIKDLRDQIVKNEDYIKQLYKDNAYKSTRITDLAKQNVELFEELKELRRAHTKEDTKPSVAKTEWTTVTDRYYQQCLNAFIGVDLARVDLARIEKDYCERVLGGFPPAGLGTTEFYAGRQKRGTTKKKRHSHEARPKPYYRQFEERANKRNRWRT